MHRLKYLLAFALPIATWYGFTYDGWRCLFPLMIIFIVFPIIELFLSPDSANMEEKLAADEKNEPFYDRLLFLAVPIILGTFGYFFLVIENTAFGSMEFWSRVLAMGIISGIFGINVGHELTHRPKEKVAYYLGHLLLLTSLNLHFVPYHLGGHHRNVGKKTDPSTATKNEWLYSFWFRSQIGGYFQAWEIDNRITQEKGHSIYSWHNRMVRYSFITLIYLVSLFFLLGTYLFLIYLMVVIISICLLETINYIEHYGLVRQKNEKGMYEPVRHHHSWNSDHIFGRALMFNLSRHSDHHYNGSIKYQVLKSVPDAPQMPTGYPGMFVMAFFPPLWFYVMNPRLRAMLLQ